MQLLDKIADVVYVYAVLKSAQFISRFALGLVASCISCRIFTLKDKQT